MSEYDDVLEIVAENPGVMPDGVAHRAGEELDEERAGELLQDALDAGDVTIADGRYWVMRKGKYASDVYDHPMTDLRSL